MKLIRTAKGWDWFWFNCPGCKEEHRFSTAWKFNQDLESPTISPSIKVDGYRFIDRAGPGTESEPFICHSYIKEGKIQFLGDCTHELKGTTVPLIPYE